MKTLTLCLLPALGLYTLRAPAATTINAVNNFSYGANSAGWIGAADF